MKLTSKAALQIQKPIDEVYEAIVNPSIMTKYFISESSGRLDSKKEIRWKFPEFKGTFPITNIKTDKNKNIAFVWDPETTVTITLKSLKDNSTLVKVNESGKELNENNIEWLVENSGGWSNFLACMKAYLEYGIQLRKGAFDFMKK